VRKEGRSHRVPQGIVCKKKEARIPARETEGFVVRIGVRKKGERDKKLQARGEGEREP